MKHPPIFGYLAEFETPTELVDASRKVYAEGYRKIDAYSPFPIEAASEALQFETRLPLEIWDCPPLTSRGTPVMSRSIPVRTLLASEFSMMPFASWAGHWCDPSHNEQPSGGRSWGASSAA